MKDIHKARQKVFDKALEHLRKQGKKSLGAIGCAYRGDNGLKCAIGVFISDRKYNQIIEGKLAKDISHILPKTVSMCEWPFLTNIQERLHDDLLDGPDFLIDLELNAERLASLYDLKYTPPGDQP